MQSSKIGKFNIWYENSDEFYELKKEIFGENCYYLELDSEAQVIVDCGAHIGMTVIYFKMLFPKAKILAYEPIPDNFVLLKKNVEENQLDNVEIFQAAVAPKTGKIVLYESNEEVPWKSGAGIIPNGWRGLQKTSEIKVEAVGITEILSSKVDLLKMDIEGMEYEVIRNAGANLRNAKNIILEVHPREHHNIHEVERLLLNNGYKIEVVKDDSSMGPGLSKIFAVLK